MVRAGARLGPPTARPRNSPLSIWDVAEPMLRHIMSMRQATRSTMAGLIPQSARFGCVMSDIGAARPLRQSGQFTFGLIAAYNQVRLRAKLSEEPLEFGYFTLSDDQYPGNRRSPKQLVSEIVEQAVLAEKLGMHSTWTLVVGGWTAKADCGSPNMAVMELACSILGQSPSRNGNCPSPGASPMMWSPARAGRRPGPAPCSRIM